MTKLKFIFKIVGYLYFFMGVGHAFAWLISERMACASESWFSFFWCPNTTLSPLGFALKYVFEVLFWPSNYFQQKKQFLAQLPEEVDTEDRVDRDWAGLNINAFAVKINGGLVEERAMNID